MKVPYERSHWDLLVWWMSSSLSRNKEDPCFENIRAWSKADFITEVTHGLVWNSRILWSVFVDAIVIQQVTFSNNSEHFLSEHCRYKFRPWSDWHTVRRRRSTSYTHFVLESTPAVSYWNSTFSTPWATIVRFIWIKNTNYVFLLERAAEGIQQRFLPLRLNLMPIIVFFQFHCSSRSASYPSSWCSTRVISRRRNIKHIV